MGRRTVLLIAALVVAALGTAMVFLYVNNVEDDIYADAKVVKVLQAQQPVAAGTTAGDASAAGAFELVELPSSAVPTGALSDISQISTQVALAPIFEDQLIMTQMFGTQQGTSTLNVPKGQMAISVQLGDPHRVAGFVEPGSTVSVFATLDDAGEQTTRVLLTEADVIAVGATTLVTQTTTDETGESTTEEIPRAILTLALDQQDAQRVIFAQEQGPLYFGLLPEDATVRAGGPTNSQNLFN